MQTVQQVIDRYKSSECKISAGIWLCPDCTIGKIGIGKEYTLEIGSNRTPPEYLQNVECVKSYMDSGQLCIIFRNTEELQKQIEHVRIV